MKKIIFILCLMVFNSIAYSQNLIDLMVKAEEKTKTDTTKPDSVKVSIDALGKIVSNATGFSISPSILFGTSLELKNNWKTDIRIMGAQTNIEVKKTLNGANLFIPEYNLFAVDIQAVKIIKKDLDLLLIRDLGVNFGGNIGWKNLGFEDSLGVNKETIVIGNFRFGLEGIIKRKTFSIYGGINYLPVLSNVSGYEKLFTEKAAQKFIYWDFGVKILIKKNVILDLSGIIRNDDIKFIRGNNKDPLLFLVKIGFSNILSDD